MSESLRILVIDDDPVMRELLEAVLGFAGHDVASVDSGELAVEQLEKEPTPPDVVLTDLHMPGLQGHELAARLQQMREPGTLLVGMSGSYPSEEETLLLDYFLQKPFTPEQFDEALRSAREGHHGRSEFPEPPPQAVTPVLNEEVFGRLAATIPAPQLRRHRGPP
jgi:CheY-like chemotaxis protein